MTLVVLFLLALAGQDAASQDEAVQAPDIPPVLRRDPRELSRAEPGRWSRWGERSSARPVDPVVDDLRTELSGSFEAGDLPRALEILYQVLEIEPDQPDALVFLGLTYFRLQRYGDAIVAYERFLEVVPGHPEHTHALGHSYYSLGEYERAREHYQRILAVVPRSPEALRGAALANLKLGRDGEALRLLDEALQVLPDDVESVLWRARLLDERARSEEALAQVDRGLELAPFDPRFHYLRMRLLDGLGHEEEAREVERRWRELDRVAQELRTLEAILRIHPRRFDLIGRTVELHRSVGDVSAVRVALDRLEWARPDEVPLVELRIYALDVLASLGDREGAARAAERLEHDCPDELATWERLEHFFASIRDRPEQVRAGRRASELR